jgi:glycerol kinase
VNIGMPDVSALGAAYMAGLMVGVYESVEKLNELNSGKRFFEPGAGVEKVRGCYEGCKGLVCGGRIFLKIKFGFRIRVR